MGDLPLGCTARIAEIRGGRQLARRLLALGLRVGSEILVLHHRGNGLVVSRGDTRVALGGGIVEKLWVEPLIQRPLPEKHEGWTTEAPSTLSRPRSDKA